MKIYFAKTIIHIDQLINNFNIDLDRDIIVPLMPKAVLYANDKLSKKFKLPIEYLDKKTRESIYADAIQLSKTWYLPIINDVKIENVDVLSCCRLQFLAFFQDVLASNLIASALIDLYKPQEVFFFNQPVTASFDNSMHDGTADIIEAVLQWKFNEQGIFVRILEKNDKSNVNYAPIFKATKRIKTTLNKIKSIIKIFAHAGTNHTEVQAKINNGHVDSQRIILDDIPIDKPLLIGLGSGYDLLILWKYLKAFATEIDGYPLLINYSDTLNIHSLRSSLIWDKDAKYLYIGDIPSEASENYYLNNIIDKVKSFLYANSNCPTILKNKKLSFQYQFLIEALIPGVVDSIKKAKYFFSRFKTVILVDDYCAGHNNRAWVEIAKQFQITTLGVPHGAINLTDFNDFVTDYFLTWGDLSKISLQNAFPEKCTQIYAAGDPLIGNLFVPEICDSNADKRNSVLLLTGGFLHQAWCDMDVSNFINTWDSIIDIARKRPGIEFIIKPHPSFRDLGYWYRQLVLKNDIHNISVIEDKKIEELLPNAFLAVLVGKPGTAGIISAQYGVPFIYLDTMLCRDVIGYKIWIDKNGSPRLIDVKKLADYIDSSYLSEGFSKSLLQLNNEFISKYVSTFNPKRILRNIPSITNT